MNTRFIILGILCWSSTSLLYANTYYPKQLVFPTDIQPSLNSSSPNTYIPSAPYQAWNQPNWNTSNLYPRQPYAPTYGTTSSVPQSYYLPMQNSFTQNSAMPQSFVQPNSQTTYTYPPTVQTPPQTNAMQQWRTPANGYPMMNPSYPYASPMYPPPPRKKETKPWGDTRYIWPDFYTDMTSELWDKGVNAPYDMGYMPGGWRFPSLSSPDPVTVGDAVTNQFPPVMEEIPNFMPFLNNF